MYIEDVYLLFSADLVIFLPHFYGVGIGHFIIINAYVVQSKGSNQIVQRNKRKFRGI